MAILANDGRMALEGVSQYSYSVNQTNLSNSVAVTGVQDSIYTTWAGIYGSQLNLPYNNIQSNSYLNLYTRHMGGWATVELGTGAGDVYDTVALQRTGDWVLNFQGGDKLIAGAAVAVTPQNDAYIYVNAYITSNASFNTDGSLKLVAGRSGSQDVSFESGLTGSQTWVRQKDNNTGWGASGNRYETWTVNTPSLTNATKSTAQHDYAEQDTAVGLTQNAAGDVNGTSTVTLGEGTDILFLLNNVRTVTDFWWQSYWIFGGAWHGYTYNENAWSVYWDGDNWKAYNNFKDYTIDISTDVESVYYSYVNDDGTIDYQVFNGNSPNVNHYSGGFPGSGGGSTPNNNPTNPLSLSDSGFVPSTDTGGNGNANIQIVAPKGSTVSFHTGTGDHNEGDTTAGLRTFTQSGAQQLSFAQRLAGNDSANAELGVIRITMGASIGDSQYNLYLGTNNSDAAVNLTTAGATMKSLAYGFVGNDNITGTDFADTLIGGAGDDTLVGGAGNDSLFGGTGADTINGGLGADWIDGGDGADTLNGSGDATGADTVFGGVSNDNLTGGDQDVLIGGTGDDTLTGADGINAHTYLMDDSGTNSYVTDGGDYYYYNAASAINHVTGTNINSGTMLLEAGTTSTGSTSGSATVSFAYVYDTNRATFTVDGTKDVIVLSGGDLTDTIVSDSTSSFLWWTWWSWRSYSTITSPIANNSNRVNSTSELMTWMTDGQSWWDADPYGVGNVGWQPEVGPAYGSVATTPLTSFITGVANYKGYFTAYLNGYTEIFYANDAAGNHDGNITINELSYIGSIAGRYAGGYAFGALSGFTKTAPDTQPAAPTVPTDPITARLASASDTGIQGDNMTNLNTGIQVTANVEATAPSDIKAYIWTDTNTDGVVDSVEVSSALTMTSTSITNGVFTGTLPGTFNNGTTTKVILTQTQNGQESPKFAEIALPITIDSVAPLSANTPTMTPVGGNIVSNALNASNTHANFSANITAGQLANGGYAEFYIGTSLVGTDNDIANTDTSVTFTTSDGTPSAAELQSFVTAGGVLSVKLYDAAGNLTTTTGSTILVDYVPPVINSSFNTSTLMSGLSGYTFTNGGSLSPSYLNISDASFAINTATIVAGETISLQVSSDNSTWTDLANSENTSYNLGAYLNSVASTAQPGEDTRYIRYKVTDLAGNITYGTYETVNGGLKNSLQFSVDFVAPDATATIGSVTDNVGSITGTLTTGGVTDDTTLALSGTITGTMNAGEVLAVYDGATRLGVATITGSNWSYADSSLANGDSVSYTVRVEDAAGNRGTASAAFTTTIDTQAPTASLTAATINTSQDAVVQSSETGTVYLVDSTATVASEADILALNGALWNSVSITTPNQATNLAATGLTAGTYKAYAVDAAGNFSTVSANTVTVTPPAQVTYLGWDAANLRMATDGFNGAPPNNVRDFFYFDIGVTLNSVEYFNSSIPTIGGLQNWRFVNGNLDNTAGIVWSLSQNGGAFANLTWGQTYNGASLLSPGPGEYFIDLSSSNFSAFSVFNGLLSTTAAGSYVFRATYGGSTMDLGLFIGDSTAETVQGSAANDLMFSRDGGGSIFGNDGNDILIAGNLFYSSITSASTGETLEGGVGNDSLYGGTGSDSLVGGDGNDFLSGGFGDDSISGGNENDTITAGSGNDSIYGDDGDDSIVGGDGNDSIIAGVGNDSVSGGDGDDTVLGAQGNDTIDGGLGNDILNGGVGVDSITSGGGTDTVIYSSNTETATVTNGDPQPATSSMDKLIGFAAGDIIDLSSISPSVTSVSVALDPDGSGDDYFLSWTDGTTTSYAYLADTGNTTGLTGTLATGQFTLADAAALSTSNFGLSGNTFSVTLGTAGRINYIREGTQNSLQLSVATSTTPTLTLEPAGAGGSGYDLGFLQAQDGGGNTRARIPDANTFLLRGSNNSNTLDVSAINTSNLTSAEVLALQKMYVFGFGGDDNITGTSVADYIDGGDGADTLSGGGGADTITGGNGSDIFDYSIVANWSTSEIITDFGNTSVNNNPISNAAISINGDVLRFDLSNLAAMTGYVALTTTAPTGSNGSTLAAADFVGGAGVIAATAANAQFIFDSTARTLYFDADGTGSSATPVVVVGDITYTGLTEGMILLVA